MGRNSKESDAAKAQRKWPEVGRGGERPGCERDAEGKGRWGEGGERPGCERDAEGKASIRRNKNGELSS